jgi:hypothetical protein
MDYKVMKRPMFKMGGKAASQGTGITSGLDEKVNMTEGRANYSTGPMIGGMTQQEFLDADPQQLNLALLNMNREGLANLDKSRDLVKLQALSNLATNVLPNIESGGFTAVTDFLKDPMTTQAAVRGLTGLKQIDIAKDKMAKENLAKVISNQIGLKKDEQMFEFGKEKFEFEKQKYEDLYGLKLDEIEIKREQLNKETDRELRERFGREADALIGQYKSVDQMPPEIFSEYERKKKIALGQGFKTKAEAKIAALDAVSRITSVDDIGFKKFNELVEEYAASIYYGKAIGNAMGGIPNRVDRAMGTPMMGEQPMNQGMGMAQTTKQDVAMETQGQGNNVYAMLRARLPQEVSDEVVKLIAYNKEAFADFASIKNQEDVSSFNDKYGVQLVIDVATV